MEHTIKIFMLYIGIIAAILEHINNYYHGRVFGHVYIYPNPMGNTLESFASIEYEFGIRSKREEDSKSGSGKS
jgi:ribosomal protein S19